VGAGFVVKLRILAVFRPTVTMKSRKIFALSARFGIGKMFAHGIPHIPASVQRARIASRDTVKRIYYSSGSCGPKIINQNHTKKTTHGNFHPCTLTAKPNKRALESTLLIENNAAG
jgi:hypothetical protein